MKTLFLIDSFALAFRMFYAFSKSPLVNSLGNDVSMVHGYWGAILRILAKHKPTHFAIVRDVNAPTFRHELYPEYKANRGPMPEEMAVQMPLLEETLRASGIALLSEQGFEADDVMASVAVAAKNAGFDRVFIVSKDKDMCQIVDETIHLFHLEKGADGIDFGPQEVFGKYGIPPEQIRDYLALMGDSSDNVPGVPKVGPKTAVALLTEYGNIDNLYENIDKIAKKGLHDNLIANKENAFLSRELVTLQSARGFSGNLKELEFKGLESDALSFVFKENELNSLQNLLLRVPCKAGFVCRETEVKKENKAKFRLVNTEESFEVLKENFKNAKEIAIGLKTTIATPMEASLIGISLSKEESEGFYIPLHHTDILHLPKDNLDKTLFQDWFLSLIKNKETEFVFHNAKSDFHVLKREFGLKEIPENIHDVFLISWMLSPGEQNISLKEFVKRELFHDMIPLESLTGKGKLQIPFERVLPEDALEYGAEDSVYTLCLFHKIWKRLQENDYEKFYKTIEIPFLKTLFEMEETGIAINKEALRTLSNEMEESIFKLEEDIYLFAGKKFNVASPKQLAEILFDDLKLPQIKKRSTDISVLEELSFATESPIIPAIIEYREQTKLLNTYVNVLPTLVNKNTNRIHTNFVQWGTATGRLSSKDPNLQNIPIRKENGKRIRASFVPGTPENVILAVDYSQIELRMLAHLSGDKNLISAYQNGEDIHTGTASAIYHVTPEAVTSDMRRSAKVINFGILYGMTSFRLARDLKISRTEAKNFIDGYFSLYQGVQDFIEKTTAFVHKNGYVETITGRKRFIPGIFSSDKTECKMAERMAVNTPVQGSASDLIKKAMIQIAKKINAEHLPLKMMLQVHDELVFECKKEYAEDFGKMIKTEMENAMQLKVPLVAAVGYGANWLEAH